MVAIALTRKLQHVCAAAFVLLSAALPAAQLQGQSSLRITSSAPAGVLNGTVMTDKTERPLLGAKVSIPRLGLTAQSDSAGDFRITGVHSGAHEVLVQLEGFEPLRTTFDFSDGEKISVDFALSERIVQRMPRTAADKARENADISRVGVEERRAAGAGRYITPEQLAKAHGKSTAEFIESHVPGLHVQKIGGDARALASDLKDGKVEPSADDSKLGAKADCYVQVLLNGAVMYEASSGNRLFDVNSIPVSMIMSADYFTPGQTPAEHQTAGSRCGTLQILTRGR